VHRAAIIAAAAGIGRPTKLFLSTFTVPSARILGRVACTLNLASRNPPHIKYIKDKNQPALWALLPSENAEP